MEIINLLETSRLFMVFTSKKPVDSYTPEMDRFAGP